VAEATRLEFGHFPMTAERSLVFGHFRHKTNVKPEVDAWIAAQRLNRLAQATVAEAMAPLMLW